MQRLERSAHSASVLARLALTSGTLDASDTTTPDACHSRKEPLHGR
jgi:hypothetical protein